MDDLTLREIVRGTILRALQYDRHRKLSDVSLKASVLGLDRHITMHQVRHIMVYLEDKNLVEIERKNSNLWMARLNAKGVDVLEGREEIKGIIVSE